MILVKTNKRVVPTRTSNSQDAKMHPVSNFTKRTLLKVKIKKFKVWLRKMIQLKKSFEPLYTLKVKKYYQIEKKKKYGSSYATVLNSFSQSPFITNTSG